MIKKQLYYSVVLDGNAKCRRMKCMAQTSVNYEYEKQGCPNTPELKTYFCQIHRNNIHKGNNDVPGKYSKLPYLAYYK